MLTQFRNVGLTVIGASITIIMLGFAAIMALPILIGSVVLAVALQERVRSTLDRMRSDALRSETIEGEWTVIDLRDPAKRGL